MRKIQAISVQITATPSVVASRQNYNLLKSLNYLLRPGSRARWPQRHIRLCLLSTPIMVAFIVREFAFWTKNLQGKQ
ncbi:hypothetical protein, partial [Acidiphilium sp. PM]|uniref:hypothetical protein n=1 Tax=Acidiphilium sp. PM TaxID=1043206 RepID=UPI0019D6C196